MALRRTDKSKIVYSTQWGRMCATCGEPVAKCRCKFKTTPVRSDGTVRIRRETKGRRGKTVTTISGLPLDSEQLKELAAEFKRTCGSGGAVKEGVIEIQGDHQNKLSKELQRRGYKVGA